MKIGLVLDDSLDKTDGVQQYVLTLGHYLKRSGHTVHYLVGQTERTDLANVHSLSRNLQVHFNQNRMSTPLPASSRKIKQLLEREQFDVLHVQMPYSPWLAGRIIKQAPSTTAVIGTFHIVPFSKLEARATRLLGLSLRRNLRRFDEVVSVSEPAAAFAKHSFRMRSVVVPNAVNLSAFHTGKRIKRYNDGKVTIVFLGRLVERKGCFYLLKALVSLHAKNYLDNVRVIICGKGPQAKSLEAYVQDHHLGQHVHFTGYLHETDKPDYLASADIAVFPSTGGESFGIVLVEAMATVPGIVLGGDNVGYRSVLQPHPEQLINPSDTVALAKTLRHYIRSKPARERAMRWQRAAAQQYDINKVGETLLGIYQQALQRRQNMQ
ncbi:MAG TPA: glycosyltransferase family 4 protein [Patescibacteria group bacterium]|nr:glycosyltransferase family 4 protein [Patescibacteria group bacterium]